MWVNSGSGGDQRIANLFRWRSMSARQQSVFPSVSSFAQTVRVTIEIVHTATGEARGMERITSGVSVTEMSMGLQGPSGSKRGPRRSVSLLLRYSPKLRDLTSNSPPLEEKAVAFPL
jgi:hypothetical protein